MTRFRMEVKASIVPQSVALLKNSVRLFRIVHGRLLRSRWSVEVASRTDSRLDRSFRMKIVGCICFKFSGFLQDETAFLE